MLNISEIVVIFYMDNFNSCYKDNHGFVSLCEKGQCVKDCYPLPR